MLFEAIWNWGENNKTKLLQIIKTLCISSYVCLTHLYIEKIFVLGAVFAAVWTSLLIICKVRITMRKNAWKKTHTSYDVLRTTSIYNMNSLKVLHCKKNLIHMSKTAIIEKLHLIWLAFLKSATKLLYFRTVFQK